MSAPVTVYAEAMAGWEAWQEEYRYGVLLLFPPEPLRTRVNELRALHDPRSQASCDAHISLTVPLPGPLSEAGWRELAHAVRDLAPFELHYGPLKHYLPHPGVVLDVGPFAAVDRVRRALEAAPPFAEAPPRRWPFKPHMTIAEFISAERTLELMRELVGAVPDGSWLCDAVSYAVPDERFHFAERRRLEFGDPSG